MTICSYRIIMEYCFIRLHVYPSFYFPFVLNLVAPGNIFRFRENSISWKSSNFLKPKIYDKRMVLYFVNICFQLKSNIFCLFLIDISMNAGFFSSIKNFIKYIHTIDNRVLECIYWKTENYIGVSQFIIIFHNIVFYFHCSDLFHFLNDKSVFRQRIKA